MYDDQDQCRLSFITSGEISGQRVQGLFEPMCATTLYNLDSSIPCCQLCSGRVVHCCGVRAFSGIVEVGGCQCNSARRFSNSAPTNRISREERRELPTRKRQETTIESYPLHQNFNVSLGGLFTCQHFLCERLFPSKKWFHQNLHSGFDVCSPFSPSRVTESIGIRFKIAYRTTLRDSRSVGCENTYFFFFFKTNNGFLFS